MISFEILRSDSPHFLGQWDFDWNKIVLGGPKGLRFCSLVHPAITLSLYKGKYILFEAEHYKDSVTLEGRKVSFPFVAQKGNIVETKFFQLMVMSFSESTYESIDSYYKKMSDSIDLKSQEAQIIRKILDE